MKPKIYFSVPNFTEPQKILVKQITTIAEDNGLDVLLASPQDGHDKRKSLLLSAQFVFAWFDYLLPKGQFMYIVSDVAYDEIAIPLPEQYIELIGIGMQAKGVANMKPKSGLILPGQDSTGVEIENLPTAIRATAPGGIFAKMVGGGAVNIPDPGVMFEVGMARVEKIPVIGMALASPKVGPHGEAIADLMLNEFDYLSEAFSEISGMIGDHQSSVDKLREHQKIVDAITKKRNEKAIREVG